MGASLLLMNRSSLRKPVPDYVLFPLDSPLLKSFCLGLGLETRSGISLNLSWTLHLNERSRNLASRGDTEVQTLERTVSEGLSYLMSAHRETGLEKLLPKIPGLVQDCMQCIRETVIPYFEKVGELRSHGAA